MDSGFRRNDVGCHHSHHGSKPRKSTLCYGVYNLRSKDAKMNVGSLMHAPEITDELQDQPAAAVSVRDVYKLFGGDVDAALVMAQEGAGKEEVQEATESVLALADVSFDAYEGEIFVVMGLSGCGKSTLIRCINRLIDPTDGEIWIESRDVLAMDEDELREMRRHSLAMVFQHYGLLPHRTVLDNVALGLELRGTSLFDRRARALDALETVGLAGWESSMVGECSGGMKQRVGLARALAQDSPVLLMDEPFSALDPLIRRELQDELVELQKKVKKTIIFITHDLDEAVRIGDRIAIMRDGKIVQMDVPTEVALNPADDFVREFTKEVRQHALVTAEIIMHEAEHIVQTTASASSVIEQLTESDENYAMVVDENSRYVGTALLQRLRRATVEDDTSITETPLLIEEGVAPETVLDQLVPIGLRAGHSIPVLEQNGVLVGEVSLTTLAQAMESDTAETAA